MTDVMAAAQDAAGAAPGVDVAASWLVGIGSSAGGVEALRELLPGLGSGDVVYIIAQHMSPVHPSLLLQVLSRETELEVAEIADGIPLRTGTIFVAPPNCDVEVRDGFFRTRQAEPRISPQPSIDVLLRSLAREAGPRSIAVVLSGTGSDGVTGSDAIRTAGGRTVAQDPATARYRDMPSAVIDAGGVDFVRSPQDMGALIAEITAGGEPARSGGRFAADPTMAALARETRRVTGWDLAAYKDGTLGRQLDKRIAALGLSTRQDYLSFVQKHPSELALLRDSMLINVTSFLRDRAAYDGLRHALQTLVAGKDGEEPLRAWVAGCATGEEAYSIAILLAEANREFGTDRGVKIFATDISDAAMESARRGVYPVSALKNVPPEWVQRYFTVEGDHATVSKRLRDMLVIARQDITRDPPLVRMDLVSCRNLLIYLIPEVQQRVIANLHASLNPRGLLFLGRSESVPADSDLFTTVSAGNRIFQRRPGPAAAIYASPLAGGETVPVRPRTTATRIPRDQVRDDIRDLLLSEYGPPALLIDGAGVPIHQIGDVSRFLSLPGQNGDFTVLSMILPSLRTEVTTLLSRLNREGLATATHPITLQRDDGHAEGLVIHASRVTPGGSSEPYVLLAFVPAPAPVFLAEPLTESNGIDDENLELMRAQVAALEHELSGTREHLQAVVEELESSNEELQAMNEELQASSEELQATNEELETTNEELQATNEELTTVNETLEVRTSELTETNEVLRNIQESVHTAIVLVDLDQRVLQYSPLAVKVFGLVRDDLGTPLRRLPSHLDIPDLPGLVQTVLATGEGQVVEAATSTADYYVQVMPYRVADRLAGAVIALSDVSELTLTRREAERRGALLQGIFGMAGVPMAWLAEDGSLTQANPDLVALTGLSAEALVGTTLVTLVAAADRNAVADAVHAIASGSEGVIRIPVDLATADYGTVPVDLTLASLESETGGARALLATVHDRSAAQLAYAELETRERQLEAVFTGTGAAMAIVDLDGRVARANTALCDVLGYSPAELVGRHFGEISYPDDLDADAAMFNAVIAGKRTGYQMDKRYVTKDGRIVWGRLIVRLLPSGTADEPPMIITTVLDITGERMRQEAALTQAQSDPLTGLANRVLAFDRLRQSILRARRNSEAVTVLFVDLNGFKGINDRLGHDVGDGVLKEVAHRIQNAVRETDTVARIGGDEFLIIAPQDEPDGGHEGFELAQRIVETVRAPLQVAGAPEGLIVTASVGLAHCPTDGYEVEELVRKADVAMYASKRDGGNGIAIYSSRLNDHARRIARLRSEVLEGLHGRLFVPYFQPIISSSDNHVRGFEVLARWLHPERGLLAPNDFLSLIVDFRQLAAFTQIIVEQATDAARRLRAIDSTLEMSVNVDPLQLRDVELQDMLAMAIGPDLTGWCIEITETSYIGGDPAIRHALDSLKKRGARSSLDDFGTGYSSVMHLKAWGFDEVKIDREFVTDIGRDEVRSLVQTMVSMARALGARTVAEGVETENQAQILRDLGADFLQGYLYSPPLDVDEAVSWLERYRREHP
jgi:two-component system CheB/CheR fusion protein